MLAFSGIYSAGQLAFGQAVFGIVVFLSILLFVYPRILSNPSEVCDSTMNKLTQQTVSTRNMRIEGVPRVSAQKFMLIALP